jgi:hypothetical protein
MRRSLRTLFAAGLILAGSGLVGCSNKSESTPNPDLKIPDIPKGERKMPGEGGKKEKS